MTETNACSRDVPKGGLFRVKSLGLAQIDLLQVELGPRLP
jgi:hypothetical protein